MFILILGIAISTLGIYSIKKPNSWLFRRIGDDSETSDSQQTFNRDRGLVILIMGVIFLVGGILNVIN